MTEDPANLPRFIVMVAAAKMPSSCMGQYKRIAIVETDMVTMPKMISNRANGVVRIVQTWDRLSVGKTKRCAYAVALAEAKVECAKLNAAIDGCGTIDGHDEEDDLRLLVASIDKQAIDGMDLGAPFWDAMARRDPLLRHTAAKWKMEVSKLGEPLPPKTIRVCASFLLSD